MDRPRRRRPTALAAALVGGARERAARLDRYRQQVAALTTALARLHRVVSTLPVDEVGDADGAAVSGRATRLLRVRGVRDDPGTVAVLSAVVERFAVAAVLDVGGGSGAAAEHRVHDLAAAVPVPCVSVRDPTSAPTGAPARTRPARGPGAVVLDAGAAVEVAGLRVAAAAAGAAAGAAAAEGGLVDVALVHARTAAGEVHPVAPLVIDGRAPGTPPAPGDGRRPGGQLEVSVLHVDRRTRRLLAVDAITVGALGEGSVSVERHAAGAHRAAAPDLAGG